MPEPNVIIVPETDEFIRPVSHKRVIWININLGKPLLEERNVHYIAPYWLQDDRGADSVYHILSARVDGEATEITLGNSFVLPKPLTGLIQRRAFSYKRLSELGFIEIREGLLMPLLT